MSVGLATLMLNMSGPEFCPWWVVVFLKFAIWVSTMALSDAGALSIVFSVSKSSFLEWKSRGRIRGLKLYGTSTARVPVWDETALLHGQCLTRAMVMETYVMAIYTVFDVTILPVRTRIKTS